MTIKKETCNFCSHKICNIKSCEACNHNNVCQYLTVCHFSLVHHYYHHHLKFIRDQPVIPVTPPIHPGQDVVFQIGYSDDKQSGILKVIGVEGASVAPSSVRRPSDTPAPPRPISQVRRPSDSTARFPIVTQRRPSDSMPRPAPEPVKARRFSESAPRPRPPVDLYKKKPVVPRDSLSDRESLPRCEAYLHDAWSDVCCMLMKIREFVTCLVQRGCYA